MRSSVDGAPKMPDAPPLDRREIAAFQSQWAEEVVEAYYALYASSGGPVTVSAVRFADTKWVKPNRPAESFGRTEKRSERLVLGDIVMRVSGDANADCFKTIANYLGSLG